MVPLNGWSGIGEMRVQPYVNDLDHYTLKLVFTPMTLCSARLPDEIGRSDKGKGFGQTTDTYSLA